LTWRFADSKIRNIFLRRGCVGESTNLPLTHWRFAANVRRMIKIELIVVGTRMGRVV
tara:strand:- start:371 stop:541 length:171 start_codon:yes stop_codon:yes gene_type:complete